MTSPTSPTRTAVIYSGSNTDYRGMEFVIGPCACRHCWPAHSGLIPQETGYLSLRHPFTRDVVLRHVRPTSVVPA